MHEAERLQQDLARAGITPFAWVINQSFLFSGTADPFLDRTGPVRAPFVEQVVSALAPRTALIPLDGIGLIRNKCGPAFSPVGS